VRTSPRSPPGARRTGHGYAAHRLLGKLVLPRPITIGLATPARRALP